MNYLNTFSLTDSVWCSDVSLVCEILGKTEVTGWVMWGGNNQTEMLMQRDLAACVVFNLKCTKVNFQLHHPHEVILLSEARPPCQVITTVYPLINHTHTMVNNLRFKMFHLQKVTIPQCILSVKITLPQF